MARGIGIFPLHGTGRFVVLTDVSHELSFQVGDGSEYAARDNIALNLAEPQLDLVQPRRVGGREVQVNLGVCRQEVLDRCALVGREIVGNHVDLLATRLVDHDVGEERDELGGSVPRRRFAEHLAGLRVEGGIQRQRTMAKVLKAVPFGPARRQRQHRILAIQGLDRRLLVHAEHGGMRRRIQVQPDDVRGLFLKVRIVRGHVAFDPMRLEPVLAPHPGHHHVAHVQMRGQFARAPVGRPTRRGAACRLQNPGFQLRRAHRGDLSEMPAVESSDPLLGKPFTPARHKAPAAVDPLRYFIPRMAFGQQQDQPRPSGIFRPIRPAIGSPPQFHTLRIRQRDRVCHGRDYSL